MPNWGLPAFSWLISFYFFAGFVADLGFPPNTDVSVGHVLLIALWLFFLFLPFFKKVRIGRWLELEREVEKAKAELSEFKAEVRNSLAIISTNVNTMGNLSNQITVNVPGGAALNEIREDLDKQSNPETLQEAKEIRAEIAAIDGEDQIMALARTRIRLEYSLRDLLGKRTSVRQIGAEKAQFIGVNQLSKLFFERYPDRRDLREPLNYVFQVCNAAIHGQRISPTQADEAIEMGSRILAILQELRADKNAMGSSPAAH